MPKAMIKMQDFRFSWWWRLKPSSSDTTWHHNAEKLD